VASAGGVSVLHGITASFGEQPIHAIIGPNGAGKSTFFNVLTGRLRADRGKVTLNGADVSRLPTFLRCRSGLGIKMQVPCMFQDLTVRENIALAILATASTVRITDALERVGLQRRIDDFANTLSHGEQQWLEIALVLAKPIRNPP
jgi:branched-chain amino acid transport system ATP-binding protein